MNNMKTTIYLFFVIAFTSVNLYAQDLNNTPSITVGGVAEIMVEPDEVVISVDVLKVSKDLPSAKREVDQIVARMLDLAKRFGVQPMDVKTDNISVDMRYERRPIPGQRPTRYTDDDDDDDIPSTTRVFLGYEVSVSVVTRLRSIDRFEEFFAEAIKTGITEVDSVRFESSEIREYRVQARDMAMRAARTKAAAMAGSIDQTIGKAIRIAEVGTPGYTSSNVHSNTLSTGGDFTSTVSAFAAGAIRVSAQVTVTFALQ